MSQILIGSIIGFVMGLTGAGGALVSLPLFMNYLAMDLKTASVFSLLAVMIASLLNLFFQKGSIHFRVVLLMTFASAMSSWVSVPLKAVMPNLVIQVLLLMVSLFALVHLWTGTHEDQNMNFAVKGETLKALVSGLCLGVLTTITGLGGGVLLVPIFIRFFHLGQSSAVKNSLLAVGVSAFLSFFIQTRGASQVEMNQDLFFLSIGIVIMAFGMRIGLRYMKEEAVSMTRKLVFTIVVVYSIGSIFNRG